jgi:hypothetical protein
MWMKTGCFLGSRFTTKFKIFHFLQNHDSMCWQEAVVAPHLMLPVILARKKYNLRPEFWNSGIDQSPSHCPQDTHSTLL